MLAAVVDNVEVVRVLLAASARLHTSVDERGGLTGGPLLWAARYGSVKSVLLLLEAGAVPTEKSLDVRSRGVCVTMWLECGYVARMWLCYL